MNTAIIVAAGLGKRFGGFASKQFQELLGKPLLLHTIDRFEQHPLIDRIVIVLAEREIKSFSERIPALETPYEFVAGGVTRLHSVRAGLECARAGGVVAIHDGARPVVPREDIRKVVEAADASGAACLVAPVNETVKEIVDGTITRTLERSVLRRALTPQCFQYKVITEVYDSLAPNRSFTDDCAAAEAAGIPVSAVEGSPFNIKITYKEDMITAAQYLKELLRQEEAASKGSTN